MATTTPAPHPLPDLSHLGSADFERVYEPSDDTFLLVDALAADAASLQVHSRYTRPRYTLTLHAHAPMLSRSHARPHPRPRSPRPSPSRATGALARPLHRGRLRLGRRDHAPRFAAAAALGMDARWRRQRRCAARERGHRGPQRREPAARADGPPVCDAARPDRRAPRCLLTLSKVALIAAHTLGYSEPYSPPPATRTRVLAPIPPSPGPHAGPRLQPAIRAHLRRGK